MPTLALIIVSFILNTGSAVKDLAQRTAESFRTTWDTLASFFTEQRQAAGYVAVSSGELFSALWAFGGASVDLGVWVAIVYVPRIAANVTQNVIGWTINFVGHELDVIRVTLSELRQWAGDMIAIIRSDLLEFVRSVTLTINNIIALLSWVRDHVVQFLTDPMILAQWLLIPLWHVGSQWVENNAEAIGRWFLGIAVRATLSAGALIEDVIVSIF